MIEKMILQYGKERRLAVGIATAEPFSEIRSLLEQDTWNGFVEQDIEKRITPSLSMPDVKSIIVLAMSYQKEYVLPQGGIRGRFSMGAVGRDYHKELMEYLEELGRCLKSMVQDISYQAFTDTGPLVDRQAAVRSGIGYIGKNGCVHVPQLGSAVFLGYLMVNIKLAPLKRLQENCGECDLCLRACPSGALTRNGFYGKRCISYITQKKGLLTRQEMISMGIQLYGCDVCQTVCPHNADKRKTSCTGEEIAPLISDILYMNEKSFRQSIGQTAAGWRGRKWIQRNAAAILGNYHNKESLNLLEQVLWESRPILRQTGAAALANLGLSEGIPILECALIREQEREVREEIQKAIHVLKHKLQREREDIGGVLE